MPPLEAARVWNRRVQAATYIAADNAVDVDAKGRFPSQSIAAIKEQRLLGLMVPSSLGGEGAAMSDIGEVCYLLAQSCASTAMIFAMHQIKTACLLRHRRSNQVLDELLRRLCQEQLLLASSTTEGKGGGNVRASEAPVTYQNGRISLERRASVISYGAYADGIVTTARRNPEAEASDQVLVAFLKHEYTLIPQQSWNTMGMRGTCSEGYLLQANGSPEQILPDSYEVIHSRTMVPTAHLMWGSVWAGIAAGAVSRAQAFIRHASRSANGQVPPGAANFAQTVGSLRTLRAVIANAMRVYMRDMNDPEALSKLEFQTLMTVTKVEASEQAVDIVLAAMRVCGLAGYRTDSEFSIERSLRDVLSAPIMINNDRILANLGATSLMTAIPRSLHD